MRAFVKNPLLFGGGVGNGRARTGEPFQSGLSKLIVTGISTKSFSFSFGAGLLPAKNFIENVPEALIISAFVIVFAGSLQLQAFLPTRENSVCLIHP